MTADAEGAGVAPSEPNYRRRLPAGVIDSGFAALANFAVGLTAVNLFDDVNRGVWAVYFAAFVLGGVIPRYLIYMPAEVRSVAFGFSERLVLTRQSLRLGIVPAIVGALAAVAAFIVTSGYATPSVNMALALTCGIAIVLSPMQDHMRAMFHAAALNWRASSVSIVQFTTVVIALAVALAVDVPIAWVPFGALCVANAVSLVYAWVSVRVSVHTEAPEVLRFRSLAEKGRWLVLNAIAPQIAGFAVATIIYALAGPEDLGYAESARVVAQPILVLAMGLSAVLSPRSMRAAMDLDEGTARRTTRIYLIATVAGGGAYLLIAGWDSPVNPMAYLVPSAYVVSGLAAVTIVANIVLAPTLLQIAELLGAHRERRLATISWIVNPLQIVIGFSAALIGAFARPVALISEIVARLILQDRALREVYAAPPEPPADSAAPGVLPSVDQV
jgi:hypothetical protein